MTGPDGGSGTGPDGGSGSGPGRTASAPKTTPGGDEGMPVPNPPKDPAAL